MSQPTTGETVDGVEFHELGTDVLSDIEAEGTPTELPVLQAELGQSWQIPLFYGVTADVILEDGLIEVDIVALGEKVESVKLEEGDGGETRATREFQRSGVKGRLTFTADWNRQTLSVDGSICGWAWKWQCASLDNKQLVSW